MKISVITTSFNAVETIRDCFESVKCQSYAPVEHIIIDGGSGDGTLDIISEYGGHTVQVVSEPDDGIYDGMNKGLLLAKGDIVGFLNADDMYYGSDVLGKVAQMFKDEQVDSCYGDLVYIAEGKDVLRSTVHGTEKTVYGMGFGGQSLKGKDFRIVRYWKSGEFKPEKFYWGWMVPHPTFFVRRSVYEKYGYFNLDMGTAADYELMLRFLVKNRISSAYLPEIVVQMRTGGASNVTLKSRFVANRMDRKAWEVNELKPYPWTLMMKPLRKVGQWVSKPRF